MARVALAARPIVALAVLLAAVHAQSSSITPTRTSSPAPTVLASTRYTIDRYLNFSGLDTDAQLVSVGAVNAFNDGLGTLVTTAVLCQTPTNPSSLPYRVARVDMLLYVKAVQSNRVGIADFSIQVFSDDGSATHAPGVLVSAGGTTAVQLAQPVVCAAACPPASTDGIPDGPPG